MAVSESTVPPESIDPFTAFSSRGLHKSLSQFSHRQTRLYLGKAEDGIHPSAAAQGITSVKETRQA